MPDYKIEILALDDPRIEEALNLMIEGFNLHGDVELEKSKDCLKKAYQQGYQVLAGILGNQVVTVLGMRPFYDPMEFPNGTEINNYVVKEEFRGKGLGQQLMDEAARIAKAGGSSWVRVNVYKENPKLMQYYAALGYEKLCASSFLRFNQEETNHGTS